MRGFVNINKPPHMTSSDVVVLVRGILRRVTGERYKVGHLGTLDPLGTGVLPIAIGKATRLFDILTQKEKIYIATFKFGETTDTLDSGGTTTDSGQFIPTKQDIESVLASFVGDINQLPPQYSAKSVDGKRAYEYARLGKEVVLAPKLVHIESIKILDDTLQNIDNSIAKNNDAFIKNDVKLVETDIISCEKTDNSIKKSDIEPCGNAINTNDTLDKKSEYKFEIICGSGTYIRSLARDVAEKLGTVAFMTSICRTKSGEFLQENAVELATFEAEPLKYIIPIEKILISYPKFDLPEEVADRILNGIEYSSSSLPNSDCFLVMRDGNAVGLAKNVNDCLKFIVRL
ncbi:MAG: tRNA pseudouridine(55) synthase TruB [Clostridia bacterium]